MTEKNTISASEWAIEAWLPRLGAKPVKTIEHKDWSAPYEVDEAHLFKLADGRYAVVRESGCSCYSSDDAQVDTFDSLTLARQFWKERVERDAKGN